MCCREPAGQSEFFVGVSRLKTFNLIYCYREIVVGIVVSAIALFRLVDNVELVIRKKIDEQIRKEEMSSCVKHAGANNWEAIKRWLHLKCRKYPAITVYQTAPFQT